MRCAKYCDLAVLFLDICRSNIIGYECFCIQWQDKTDLNGLDDLDGQRARHTETWNMSDCSSQADEVFGKVHTRWAKRKISTYISINTRNATRSAVSTASIKGT